MNIIEMHEIDELRRIQDFYNKNHENIFILPNFRFYINSGIIEKILRETLAISALMILHRDSGTQTIERSLSDTRRRSDDDNLRNDHARKQLSFFTVPKVRAHRRKVMPHKISGNGNRKDPSA